MIGNLAQQTSSGSWIEAVIRDLKSVRGGMARFWAIVFGIVLLIVGPYEWRHDLEPTKLFFEANPAFGAAIVGMYGTLLAQALLILVPIVLNAVLTRYATIFKLAAWGVVLIEGADAYTDWEPASAVFNAWWAMPVFSANPVGYLWWGLWRLIWQVVCTDGFELICAAAAAGLVISLWNSFRPATTTAKAGA